VRRAQPAAPVPPARNRCRSSSVQSSERPALRGRSDPPARAAQAARQGRQARPWASLLRTLSQARGSSSRSRALLRLAPACNRPQACQAFGPSTTCPSARAIHRCRSTRRASTSSAARMASGSPTRRRRRPRPSPQKFPHQFRRITPRRAAAKARHPLARRRAESDGRRRKVFRNLRANQPSWAAREREMPAPSDLSHPGDCSCRAASRTIEARPALTPTRAGAGLDSLWLRSALRTEPAVMRVCKDRSIVAPCGVDGHP
jgi:hypothetical protein